MNNQILQPMAAMMILTFIVWVVMYVKRIGYVNANKIPADSLATPEQLNQTLPEQVNRPSNNFKNLFELPVIFYALCVALFATGLTGAFFVNLAWAYVILRALHSAIQCTVNTIPLRFGAYLLSCIVLWVMVGRFALIVF